MSIFLEEDDDEEEENVFALSILFWRLGKLSSQYLPAAYILSSITIYHMIVSIKLICAKQLPCNYNNVVIKFLNSMM
jgi:hypothetical protein